MFAFQGNSRQSVPTIHGEIGETPRSAIAKKRKGFGDMGKYKLASNAHEERYGRQRPNPSSPLMDFMKLLSRFLEMTK